MSKLISGKEALIALANGEEVEYKTKDGEWNPIPELLGSMKMRLKPRTITINGVEYIDKHGAYEAFMEAYAEMNIHPDI